MLGLVDSDIWMKIISVYMQGSKNMSYDDADNRDIKWLGVRPSDYRYKIQLSVSSQ